MKTLKILAFAALTLFAFSNVSAQHRDHDGRRNDHHSNYNAGRGIYGHGYHGGWGSGGFHGFRGHGYSRFGYLPYAGLGVFYFGAIELSQSTSIYVEDGYTYTRQDSYCIDQYGRQYICGYEWVQQ